MTTFIPLTKLYYLSVSLVLVFLSSNLYWLTSAEELTVYFHYDGLALRASNNPIPQTQEFSCKSAPKGTRKANSLEVSHKLGPCSPLQTSKSGHPTQLEILEHDEERVNSIRQRVNQSLQKVQNDKKVNGVGQEDVVLPAMSGSTIGTGNYIVTVGLGTPAKPQTLIFDTGSDFTWVQCTPCVRSCYQQQQPIFDPAQSSTYSNITCSSQLCSAMRSATSAPPGCSANAICLYDVQYGDSSFSVGFFAKDTLTLGTNPVPNFYFGCGENNQGLFGGSAGLMGLGRDKLSAVSQAASQFGNYFSYCLPSQSTATGHLTFGKGGTASNAIQYTPLLTSSAVPSLYSLDFQGIIVGGQKLAISPSVFSTAGTIIDSGTVITRLPPDAYKPLQAAFRSAMSQYPMAQPASFLDTCYDFSNFSTVKLPRISLLFGGGVSVDLSGEGIFFVISLSQVCLAFAANGDSGQVGIIGNVQQLTFDVVYDVAGGRLGFGPGGCA